MEYLLPNFIVIHKTELVLTGVMLLAGSGFFLRYIQGIGFSKQLKDFAIDLKNVFLTIPPTIIFIISLSVSIILRLILGIMFLSRLLLSRVVKNYEVKKFIPEGLTKFVEVKMVIPEGLTKSVSVNYYIPFLFALVGISIATQLRDAFEAGLFLLASITQFIAYVFVSRLRQRSSFTWHVVAAIGSNSAWFFIAHILKASSTYQMLILMNVVGILAGRTMGVNWSQYVEKKYKLQSDATRDPKLNPGKRLEYIAREPIFWILIILLVSYLTYGLLNFNQDASHFMLTILGLSLLQSFAYALNSRASNRGNSWYIAITGIPAGITFYINAAYIFSEGVPMFLFPVYVISTALGSATGAFASMIIERIFNWRPDSHIDGEESIGNRWREEKILVKLADYASIITAKAKQMTGNILSSPAKFLPNNIFNSNLIVKLLGKEWRSKLPYATIFFLALVWIVFQNNLLRYFGIQPTELEFPLRFIDAEFPRVVILIVAALIFMLDSAFHSLASRAGNRNHTVYHISTLIPKGLLDFLKIGYISMNSSVPDIVPIGVLSGSLGSLYGKDVGESAEKWLKAKMDAVEEDDVDSAVSAKA